MNSEKRRECRETVWITPEHVLEAARAYFGGPIPLDPCTEKDNPTRALRYFTANDNGLVQPWDDSVWCNPPYGEDMRAWIERIYSEASGGLEIILLIPASRFETGYFQDQILCPEQNAECIVRRRLSFLRPVDDGLFYRTYETPAKNKNPFSSIIYGFNVDQVRFLGAFHGIGQVRFIQNVEA